MMNKRLALLCLLLVGLLVGCDAYSPAYVNDSPPINVNVNAGNVTVTNNSSSVLLINSDGNPQGVMMTDDGELVVSAEDIFQEVSMHNQLEGKTAYAFHINGRRAGFTSTSTLNDVKEFGNTVALIPVLTGAEALEVVSTSVNDTAAGTGARTVQITYIDNSDNLVTSANLTLNGTTAVATGFTAHEILWMEVTSLGTSEVATGNIILRTGAGAELEQITAGGNKSLSARFMVPVGYTGYVSTWDATSVATAGNAAQDVRLRATVNCADRTLSTVYHFEDTAYLVSGSVAGQYRLPFLKMPALSRIKVSTLSSSTASTTRVDASFTIIIIQN